MMEREQSPTFGRRVHSHVPKAASQSNPTPKRCPGVSGAGTGEQERKPEMYTSGVKSLHEHTAQVSPTNTEMKLTVILRVDKNTDQKLSYCNY